MSIKGLSDKRRLPRLGKIRLGIKKRSPKSGAEYPVDVDYFVCPDAVRRVYGEQPKELDVMFPLDAEAAVFPHSNKWYVQQGLRCKGDGETAMRRVADLVVKDKAGKVIDDATDRLLDKDGVVPNDENALAEIGCPCALLETGQCGPKGSLMVLLPKVSMGGVYQIDTGSINNLIDINSAFSYIRSIIGRIALVPLKLRRVPREIQYEGKKSTHWLLQIELSATLPEVMQLQSTTRMILTRTSGLALDAPIEDGPDAAPGGVVVDEEPVDELERAVAVAETNGWEKSAQPADADLDALTSDDDPSRSPAEDAAKPTTADLKALKAVAEEVGAYVDDDGKRGVTVDDRIAKHCLIATKGVLNPRSLTQGQVRRLIAAYKSLSTEREQASLLHD